MSMGINKDIFFESFPSQPRKGDLRRLEIIETTIHCIAREGFAGSTFDHVAKHLKTRRSHIAYYFKDREELLMAALQFTTVVAQKVTIECVAKAKTPIEQILAVGEGAFEWAETNPKQAKFLILFYSMCTYNKTFLELHTRIREAGSKRLRALLADVLPEKIGELGLDGLAHVLQGLVTGMFVAHMTTTTMGKSEFRELTRTACREWIEKLAQ